MNVEWRSGCGRVERREKCTKSRGARGEGEVEVGVVEVGEDAGGRQGERACKPNVKGQVMAIMCAQVTRRVPEVRTAAQPENLKNLSLDTPSKPQRPPATGGPSPQRRSPTSAPSSPGTARPLMSISASPAKLSKPCQTRFVHCGTSTPLSGPGPSTQDISPASSHLSCGLSTSSSCIDYKSSQQLPHHSTC